MGGHTSNENPGGVLRLKLGLFGAELLKLRQAQIRTKSAKVGDGRPDRSRAPGGPSTKRSSLLRPSKAAKAGARRASAKRSSLRGGPKAAKEGCFGCTLFTRDHIRGNIACEWPASQLS